MGVSVLSVGNKRQKARQDRIATKKGYAMKTGNTKKAARLDKRSGRVAANSDTYARELSTGKTTKHKKLPARGGKVRRKGGLGGYNPRGAAQNQIRKEGQMDKFSNTYGEKGSEKRKEYLDKNPIMKYESKSKKESKVYNRLGAKRKKKIMKRETRANKNSDS